MNESKELKFLNYTVEKLAYELNKTFVLDKGKNVQIMPNFRRHVRKIDNDNYYIKLEVNIVQQQDIPFTAEVCIVGRFHFPDWENVFNGNVAIREGTTILFPYLRQLLSLITGTGNLPQYVLPIININKLFEKSEREKQPVV